MGKKVPRQNVTDLQYGARSSPEVTTEWVKMSKTGPEWSPGSATRKSPVLGSMHHLNICLRCHGLDSHALGGIPLAKRGFGNVA
jgi:hypothetical protein